MNTNYCTNCAVHLDSNDIYCFACGNCENDTTNNSSIKANTVKLIASITPLVILGGYLLIQTILLWYELSFIDTYPNILLIPVIILPILSGGYLLSAYGIVCNNRGVKPFGSTFVIFGPVYILQSGLIFFMESYFSITTPDSLILPILKIQLYLAYSPLALIILIMISGFYLIFFNHFDGEIKPFNGYFTKS